MKLSEYDEVDERGWMKEDKNKMIINDKKYK